MIPPEQDSPQRSATRAAIDAVVRMQFDDSLDVVEGRCYNISIGGMFLDSEVMRPAGSLVRFELLLGEAGSVRGLGEVVWAQEAMPGRRSGLGLKFRFLEQRDRQAIFKVVSQHIKEKLAQRPPMADEPPVPDTPLARQRRASLLGEGLPPAAPPEPPRLEPLRPPEPAAPPSPATGERPSRSSLPTISEGAPIPPPRPLDKKGDRPLEEKTWQQPTLAAGRQSRPADPSWLDDRAGFETENSGSRENLPLRPGAAEDWDDRPLGSPPAEPHHYLDDDPDHFDHRPKPKSFPVVAVVLIGGLLLLLALGYFFFFRDSAPSKPEVIRIGALPGAAPPQSTEPPPLPEPQPRTEPPRTEPALATEPPPKPADQKAPEPKVPESKAPEPKAPEPKAPEPKATAGKEFERVVAVTYRKAAGGLEIVIEGDGEIPAARISNSRLEGRELLKLFGVKARYEKKELAVGDKWVKGLRFGYHEGGARGNEIHVVIDLASPSAKVAKIRSQGRSLVVLIVTD